ncbi:MAG TPA: hypothetical protein PLI34_13465, partial [Saprospiraceae bacterium]|nr:hypothetical protein [Saprospiraceae bacterium]
MDIYTQKSRWKLYLGIAGALIVLISLVYTTMLTNRLAQEERNKVNIILKAIEDQSLYPSDECLPCESC